MVRNAKLVGLNFGKSMVISYLFYIFSRQTLNAQVYDGYKGSLSASIGLANHFNPAVRDFLKDSLGWTTSTSSTMVSRQLDL